MQLLRSTAKQTTSEIKCTEYNTNFNIHFSFNDYFIFIIETNILGKFLNSLKYCSCNPESAITILLQTSPICTYMCVLSVVCTF